MQRDLIWRSFSSLLLQRPYFQINSEVSGRGLGPIFWGTNLQPSIGVENPVHSTFPLNIIMIILLIAGFLNLSTSDILGWIILVTGGLSCALKGV